MDANYATEDNKRFCRSHAQNKKSYAQAKKTKKQERKTEIESTARSLLDKRRKNTSPKSKKVLSPKPIISTEESVEVITEEAVGVDLIFEEEVEVHHKRLKEKEERSFAAHLFTNNNCSATACEKIITDLVERGDFIRPLSRNTIIRSTGEVAIIAQLYCCQLLRISENLGLGFDGASNSDSRSHLEVEIFGTIQESAMSNFYVEHLKSAINKLNPSTQGKKGKGKKGKAGKDNLVKKKPQLPNEKEKREKGSFYFNEEGTIDWSFVLCAQQVVEKSSIATVKVIVERFGELQILQKKMSMKKVTGIDEFKYICGDWTNSNFGKDGGCVVLLDEERKKVNKKSANLIVVGCGDHSANLISKHIRSEYDSIIPESLRSKAFPMLKNLYKCVTGLAKTNFKGFVKHRGGAKMALPRMTENRYGSFNMGASIIVQHWDLFEEYCKANPISRHFNEKEFFSGKSKSELLFMMASCDRFLKPFMKEMDEAKTIKQYSKTNTDWIGKMGEALKNKTAFLKLWSVEENSRELGELYSHHSKEVRAYFECVQKLNSKKSSTRLQQQLNTESNNLYKTLKNIKEGREADYLCFCLCVEFSCEVVYCCTQRNGHLEHGLEDQPIKCGTNRSGERINAQSRRFFQNNPNTNQATVEAALQVKSLLPNCAMIVSLEKFFSKQSWWKKNFKEYGPTSIKQMARKRFKDNNLASYQISSYMKNVPKNGNKKLMLDAQELAEKVFLLLQKTVQERTPSQHLTQGEMFDSESVEESASEYADKESIECFSSLQQKFTKKNLENCVRYLRGNWDQPLKKKKDELVPIFIKEATTYLKTPVIVIASREDSLSLEDRVKQNFKKWVSDDKELKKIFTNKELGEVLRTSETTFYKFATAANKGEFVKELLIKYPSKKPLVNTNKK